MTILQRVAGVMAGLIVLSCILACGALTKVTQAKARVQTTNDLKLLALTWINYSDVHRGDTPADQQEFLNWAQKNAPDAAALIQQTGPGGKFVMRYGKFKFPASFMDAGTSNTPLVWESQVPTAGGLVGMADGAVKQMSAEEFNAAPKPTERK